MASPPPLLRLAAYAVVVRDGQVLLSRLSDRVTSRELWTLPGGGVEHGEDPRDAVVREVREETGLEVSVGDDARIHAHHQAEAWRGGRRVDAHAVRIVYEGWVAPDAPPPHTVEVDGSTAEAAWVPLAGVLDGSVPTVALVTAALADRAAHRRQRVAAYALVVAGDRVLLTRTSVRGPHPGTWVLPGGGVEHGEDPRDAVRREVTEETGLEVVVGEVLDVVSSHFEGTAPTGRREDFHAVGVVYAASLPAVPGSGGGSGGGVDGGLPEPEVLELGGTTDAAAWVPLSQIGQPEVVVADVVTAALAAHARRPR